jgi:hypothetical protein
LAYVALDETVGVARERVFGKHGEGQWRDEQSEDGRPRRVGWREGGVWWGDGMIAGGLLGLGVGAICTSFPLSNLECQDADFRPPTSTFVYEKYRDRNNNGRNDISFTNCPSQSRGNENSK